jgi:anti-sigma-K factor RskA
LDKEQFIQRSSDYALGALTPNEAQEFEAYLSGATEKEREILGEFTSVTSMLPLALERKTPPPHVKQQLMQRIVLSARAHESAHARTDELTRPTRRTMNWMPWGIGAGLAMVALFSFYVMNLMGTIADQNSKLASMETRLVELRDELSRREEQLKVLAAREIHISIMSGLQVNPVGYGKIIWDPEKKSAILQVSNLPAVPADKDYQLWVIKDKKPISAGVFAVADREPNFFKIENLAAVNPKEINAFAVTLEPKGGVPQPTGEMYMMGAPRL